MPTIFRDKVTVAPAGGSTLTFNDLATQPAGTVTWGLDVLDPWDSTSPMDVTFTPIGNVDGEVPGDFFELRGRMLTVGGYVEAVDRATAEALRDQIYLAFQRNVDVTLTRYETIPKFVKGRFIGDWGMTWVGPTAFRWGTKIKSGDPMKYGLAASSGSAGVAGRSSGGRSYPRTYPLTYTTVTNNAADSVAIINNGTGNTQGIASIHGPLLRGAWHLSNDTTGKDLRVDIDVATTDTLLIDFKNQIVTLNGSLVVANTIGDFWVIKPGVNIIKLYADYDPAAGFTMTAYPAWEN
jgi:hypothetical protein